MYEFAKYTNNDKEFAFNFVSAKKGIHKAIIEKDFWVCLTLDYLFNKSNHKDAFAFKGGTSLSKGFNIINRFSEDVDLILDWRVLGVDKDEPLKERSNTKQDKYNEHLKHLAEEFIADAILVDLQEHFSAFHSSIAYIRYFYKILIPIYIRLVLFLRQSRIIRTRQKTSGSYCFMPTIGFGVLYLNR